MKRRHVALGALALILVGLAAAGGALWGRSLGVQASEPKAVRAQALEGRYPLTFQGLLLDGEGNPVSNSGHRLTFAIYEAEAGGAALWSEDQSVFTLDGLFTAQLGVEEEIDPSIFSENPETFLSIRVGNDPELEPRIRFSYAPYALHALTADIVVNPPINPRQAALQRWYEANEAGVSVPVDFMPSAMGFDGEHVWVATLGDEDDEEDDNVTRIDAVSALKEVDVNVGSAPSAIVFDGRHMWVANRNSDDLTRFRPDGANQDTFPANDPPDPALALERPVAMAFDGANIWVVNQGDNSITKVTASDGIARGKVTVGSSPTAIAFDGQYLWVAHGGTRNISKIDPVEESVVETLSAGRGRDALAFDGQHMWVTDKSGDTVTKVRVSDNEIIGTFDAGSGPAALAFDGKSIWIVNQDSDSVTKLRASDGATIGSYHVGDSPLGITFDGANVWVSVEGEDLVVMR